MANDTSLGGLFGGDRKPTQFGRIFKPDPAWHAKADPEKARSIGAQLRTLPGPHDIIAMLDTRR